MYLLTLLIWRMIRHIMTLELELPFRRTRPSCPDSSVINDERTDTASAALVEPCCALRTAPVMMAKKRYKVVNLVQVNLAYGRPC